MSKIRTRRITPLEKRNTAIRWALYTLIILLCFVTATAGSFRKPLLLIPVALCIASYAREFTAVIAGVVCGVLLDVVCGKLLGFNGLILLIMCIGVSLLYKYYLRHRLINFMVLSAVGIFVQGLLDYFFYYALWDHSNVSLIYKEHILPCCIYTLISALPVYWVISYLNRTLRPDVVRTIEETIITEDER